MKNAKKLVALAAAATMLMSSATVYAADPISIEGEVNYVNTTIYKVTLPTNEGMKFLLDPQGLTSLDAGDYSADAAGKIVAEGEMVAKNESSVEVVLNADFYLVDSAATDKVTIIPSSGTITEVGDEGSEKQSKKEVQIYITTDDNDATTSSDPKIEVGTEAGDGTDFTMKAAEYNFGVNEAGEYTYDLTADSGSTLTMEIAGAVAKDYDWSAYADGTNTLTLNAVFGFKDAAGEEIENTEASTPVATDDYLITFADNGTASYTFVNKPDTDDKGLTAVSSAKGNHSGAIGTNITYDQSTGTISFATGPVSNWLGSVSEVSVTINGEEFTLTTGK